MIDSRSGVSSCSVILIRVLVFVVSITDPESESKDIVESASVSESESGAIAQAVLLS